VRAKITHWQQKKISSASRTTVGGAVGGAVVGDILGGVLTGRPGGAAAGAIVGGATGAVIGAQAEQRHGYYLWQGVCYYRYPSGQYAAVDPRYCNAAAA
jgi:outer membrane lipoprotein SlyB